VLLGIAVDGTAVGICVGLLVGILVGYKVGPVWILRTNCENKSKQKQM
jgi:hypothetical protein